MSLAAIQESLRGDFVWPAVGISVFLGLVLLGQCQTKCCTHRRWDPDVLMAPVHLKARRPSLRRRRKDVDNDDGVVAVDGRTRTGHQRHDLTKGGGGGGGTASPGNITTPAYGATHAQRPFVAHTGHTKVGNGMITPSPTSSSHPADHDSPSSASRPRVRNIVVVSPTDSPTRSITVAVTRPQNASFGFSLSSCGETESGIYLDGVREGGPAETALRRAAGGINNGGYEGLRLIRVDGKTLEPHMDHTDVAQLLAGRDTVTLTFVGDPEGYEQMCEERALYEDLADITEAEEEESDDFDDDFDDDLETDHGEEDGDTVDSDHSHHDDVDTYVTETESQGSVSRGRASLGTQPTLDIESTLWSRSTYLSDESSIA
eukprot:m.187837 g.187837  ORF g.187837 m.187837 type:complete len:374 (+) comp17205_c0_seq1:254-1375(+)